MGATRSGMRCSHKDEFLAEAFAECRQSDDSASGVAFNMVLM